MATGSPALGHLLRAGQTGGRGSNGAASNEKAAGDGGEPHFGGLGQRVGLGWRRMQRTGAEPRDLVLLGRREREWTAELLSQTTIFEGDVEAIYISPKLVLMEGFVGEICKETKCLPRRRHRIR